MVGEAVLAAGHAPAPWRPAPSWSEEQPLNEAAEPVVGSDASVPVHALSPFLMAATLEWERPDTARTHAKLP
jgi:hypothetical protein